MLPLTTGILGLFPVAPPVKEYNPPFTVTPYVMFPIRESISYKISNVDVPVTSAMRVVLSNE